jgi:hypothetical protein
MLQKLSLHDEHVRLLSHEYLSTVFANSHLIIWVANHQTEETSIRRRKRAN